MKMFVQAEARLAVSGDVSGAWSVGAAGFIVTVVAGV